ncbi:nitrous oxide reductase accessory protein NosL [Natronorubrum halophilum]|uniref:nitrous oxide reductase accessory protein NosL n=1 Tax=Natronorubrum halophilum TaxID=1702106 RepID=UPI0010C20A0A|nr:nitrous oxide reductase accessory protein NosL [Natronorubrum halophilum]
MSEHDDRPIARRRLLGLLGTGAATGLSGCIGDGIGGLGSDDTGGETDGSDTNQSYAPNVNQHPGDEPIEFDESHHCAVCNMKPIDYPQWRSQLAHENGEGAVFDTPGCLFAYTVATSSDSEIVGAWTTEFETDTLLDASEAHFVLITDADAADDPMKINPRVFGNYDDAVAYLDEWEAEALTEDDIIGLDDVDRETASIYRENRI